MADPVDVADLLNSTVLSMAAKEKAFAAFQSAMDGPDLLNKLTDAGLRGDKLKQAYDLWTPTAPPPAPYRPPGFATLVANINTPQGGAPATGFWPSVKQGVESAAMGPIDVLEGVGRGAINLAKMPYDVARGIAPRPQTTGDWEAALTGPAGLGIKRLVIDPMQATAEQARQETGLKRAGLAAASGIPVVGPMAAQFAEQIQKPEDISKALGEVLAYAEAPTATRSLVKGASGVPKVLEQRRIKLAVEEITRAAGGRANLQFAADLKTALPDIAEVARNSPLEESGAARLREFTDKLKDREDAIWEKGHEPLIAANPDLPIDQNTVVQRALDELTPQAKKADPAGYKRAEKWVRSLDEPSSVEFADGMVRELNRVTKNQFGKMTSIEIRVKKAAVQGYRDAVDDALVNSGLTGVREINRKWGAVNNIRQTLEKRIPGNEAAGEPSRMSMVRGLNIGAGILMGSPEAVVGTAAIIRPRKLAPSQLVSKASKRLARTKL